MPKGNRSSRSQDYYHTAPSVSMHNHSSSRSPNPHYYEPIPTMQAQSMQSQSAYSNGGPVQQPYQTQQYQIPSPMPIRASSGAWNPTDDQTLMAARAQNMNWLPIQQAYFPSKTPNACRKRHERLMERRSADDWDGIKLENLAKNYMNMRREIWQGLAAQTGEKWSVVEAKCMSSGLKNLQTAARSCARRERLETGTQPHHGAYGDPHTDDSGIGIDDLEAEYDADGGSEHSRGSMAHMRDQHGRPQYQHRLPSMDMGIDAIINRPNGV